MEVVFLPQLYVATYHPMGDAANIIEVAVFIILFVLHLQTPKTPVVAGLLAVDWLGSLSVAGATVIFLLGLTFGGVTHPCSSAIVLCLLIFGPVIFILFFLIEWKVAKYPLMSLRLFCNLSNVACLVSCFCHRSILVLVHIFCPLLPGYPRGHSTSLRSLATSICTLNVVCIWTYRLVYFSNRSIYRLCSSWIRLFCPRFWAFNRPHFPSNVVQNHSLSNNMRHWHRAKLPGSAASFTNPGSSARLCDSNSCIWLYPESCHKY